MYAYKKLTLTDNIFCYHQVFAFDIDVNNTISNLSIEGVINTLMVNGELGGKNNIICITISVTYQSYPQMMVHFTLPL